MQFSFLDLCQGAGVCFAGIWSGLKRAKAVSDDDEKDFLCYALGTCFSDRAVLDSWSYSRPVLLLKDCH